MWNSGSRLQRNMAQAFQAVGLAEARLALQAQLSDWKRWLATREAFVPAGFIDLEALYGSNLVSGMLRAEP